MSQDMVNHPDHYNQGKRETIEEMRLMFGDSAVADFCRLSAYKYMRRADHKGKKEEDLAKAEWYMDYLDKMEKEREERFAAPKPEPIHVVLDTLTLNATSVPECCDPGFGIHVGDATNIESPNITINPIRNDSCDVSGSLTN